MAREDEAAQADVPDADVPDVDVPQSGLPAVGAPDAEAPDVEAPDLEAPDAETPDVEAPDMEAPDVGAPDLVAPDAGFPGVEASEAPSARTLHEPAAPLTVSPEPPGTETLTARLHVPAALDAASMSTLPATKSPAPESPAPESPAHGSSAHGSSAPAIPAPQTFAPENSDPKNPDPENPDPINPGPTGTGPDTHAPDTRNPDTPEQAVARLLASQGIDDSDVTGARVGDLSSPVADARAAASLAPYRVRARRVAPRARPRRRHRTLIGVLGPGVLSACALLAIVAGTLFLALSGKAMPVPGWLVAQAESRVNTSLAGAARIDLGGVEIVVNERLVPRLHLRDLRIDSVSGRRLAFLPDASVTLDTGALLRGVVRPVRLRVVGATLAIRRGADGLLDLDIDVPGAATPGADDGAVADAGGQPDAQGLDLSGGRAGLTAAVQADGQPVDAAPGLSSTARLLDRLEQVFALPVLGALDAAEVSALTLSLTDARAGRTWQVRDGTLSLRQTDRSLSISVGFDLATANGAPARADIDLVSARESAAATLGARVEGVASRDLAAQVPALAFLQALDAPISGNLSAEVNGAGQVQDLTGTLNIGRGALRPSPATLPVAFDRGRLAFDFDAAAQRIVFSEIAVDGSSLRLRADGQAYLRDVRGGLPGSLLAQIRLTDVRVDPDGMFAAPVTLDSGAADLRVRLDPFAVDVGQVMVLDGARRISGKGSVRAGPQGWEVSFDAAADAITPARLVALWPVRLVPDTRTWVADHVLQGMLFNLRAAVRLAPGSPPRLSFGYEFADTGLRILKSLPPVTGASGYATIAGNRYTMALTEGRIMPPQGGAIDVSGSTLTVADIRLKPPTALVTLRSDSSVTAVLSLLDQPPFGFLTKAGRAVDLTEGRAMLETRLEILMRRKLTLADVQYQVSGSVAGVTSDRIVPGRPLAADRLSVTANRAGMTLSGPGSLSGVPFTGLYTQSFVKGEQGRAKVEGTMELSQRFLDAFGIGLPPGSVTGTGAGQVTVDLEKGSAPRFRLVSDLNRMALRLPGTGWSKAQNRTGRLEVSGSLGSPPVVDALTLEADGLSAAGRITIAPGGALDVAQFGTVKIGNWLDGQVRLTGRGAGRPPAVAITGGRADVRRLPEGGEAGDGGEPLDVALDRVVISDTLVLTGFRGRFSTSGGFGGTFDGRVNDLAPVSGTLAPQNGGTAVRVLADDAGAVFAAAGIFGKGRGGALDLVLTPAGPRGTFDGRVTADGIRVKKAPVLADLLGAISVIGLIEQLNGDGIQFTDVQGRFRLTPEAVEVTRGSAVGPSLGVSLAGVYSLASGQVDFQGVISPIYLVNGIGAILTRRGEGFFGFNYRISGQASAPRVGVNPLSVLTPGMFRELFRGPPPKIKR